MDLRERIREDFGIDLPISGGFPNHSRSNPIIVDPAAGKRYWLVEEIFLQCLCRGRGVEQDFLRRETLEHDGRSIDRVVIRTRETTPTQIITTDESYYFDLTACPRAAEPLNYGDFPELCREIDARETVFRRRFSQEQLAAKPRFAYAPFRGDGLMEERDAVWQRLFAGQTSEDAALRSLTSLLERYYEAPYPLRRD